MWSVWCGACHVVRVACVARVACGVWRVARGAWRVVCSCGARMWRVARAARVACMSLWHGLFAGVLRVFANWIDGSVR